jgi:hypothetical protein
MNASERAVHESGAKLTRHGEPAQYGFYEEQKANAVTTPSLGAPVEAANVTVQPFPRTPLLTGRVICSFPGVVELGNDALSGAAAVSEPPPPIATWLSPEIERPAPGQRAVTVSTPAAPAVTTVVELEAALGPVAPVAPLRPVTFQERLV